MSYLIWAVKLYHSTFYSPGYGTPLSLSTVETDRTCERPGGNSTIQLLTYFRNIQAKIATEHSIPVLICSSYCNNESSSACNFPKGLVMEQMSATL